MDGGEQAPELRRRRLQGRELQGELVHREDTCVPSGLTVIEDPGYVDPAGADLPARDLTLLVVIGGLLIVLMIWWSYPA